MTTYYKATRLDGTDFATGTTYPVVGEWMPRIDGTLRLCERGYHVSAAPAETLIGGWWPCRLFEVEIDGDTPESHIDGHKRVVHTYQPIRELPAWQALGPNGQDVAALIERVGQLTPADAESLQAAWDVAGNAARYAARDVAGNAAWNAAWNAVWNTAWNTAGAAAGNAARYAALGLVVRDLITPEQFAALYGPWASVMEITR